MDDEQKKEYLNNLTQKIQSQEIKREMNIFKIMQVKWHARVLFELLEKSPRRFGELRSEVSGISNAVLTNVLKALIEKDLVIRIQHNETPLRVEYSLTESGKDLLSLFYEMFKWEYLHYPETFGE